MNNNRKNRIMILILFINIFIFMNSTNIVKAMESSSKVDFYTKISRISGKDRYDTSVQVSKSKFTSSKNVIITSGEDFADAISSASLADLLNSPILLTDSNRISDGVVEEINRLKVEKIFVIGGSSRVNDEDIASLGIEFERISGEDRYETSRKVLEKYNTLKSSNSEIIIADGNNFPDTLLANCLVREYKLPLVLVANGKNEDLYNKAKYGIGTLSYIDNKFLIERIYGKDRYETSLKVIEKINRPIEELLVVSGEEYPDALVASVLDSPFVLSNKDGFTREMIGFIGKKSMKNVKFIGGEKLLPKFLEDQVIGGVEENFNNVSLPSPMASNSGGKTIIITYHDVGEKEHRYQRTPEGLKYDVLYMYKKGYLPVSLEDYMNENINISKGYSPYVITFDDGNRNKFNILENGEIDSESSYGILKYLESKLTEFKPYATFFINGGIPFEQEEFVKRKFDLMLESGMSIGNHTLSHKNLKHNIDMIEREIALQKKNLEQYLPENYEVNTLAIPNSTTHSSEEYERILKGEYDGIKYDNIALGIGGWKPDIYPNRTKFKLLPRIPGTRIEVDGYGLYDYLDYLDENPGERFVY